MFPLFETICVQNCKLLNTTWHQKRFLSSFVEFYNHEPYFDLFDEINIPKELNQGICKLRILYNEVCKKIDFEPYTFKEIQTLKVIETQDLEYSLKYTDRSRIDQLYSDKTSCDDILIIKEGLVTDSSFCNIVFFDGKNWITPSTPLLAGTLRNRLLSEGTISEKEIRKEDIKHYISFKLINAMRDFFSQNETPIRNIKFEE